MILLHFQKRVFNWSWFRGSTAEAAVRFSSSVMSPPHNVCPLDACFYFSPFLNCPVHTKCWFLAQSWRSLFPDESIPTTFLSVFPCAFLSHGVTDSILNAFCFLLPVESLLILKNHQVFPWKPSLKLLPTHKDLLLWIYAKNYSQYHMFINKHFHQQPVTEFLHAPCIT